MTQSLQVRMWNKKLTGLIMTDDRKCTKPP